MLKIRQLIKRVRACRTAEEERSVINKESAEIRNLSKDPNAPFKARNLCKAIYMQMMGYQTSFMQMSCINLLASPDFTEKRIAYSALSLVIDSTSQVLLLATSTIKKDLQNKDNPDIQALALNAVGDVCTPDMCREISMEVANLISSAEDPNVKKKAACAAVVIIKNCPETIDSFVDKIPTLLEDRTHSVCLSGIYLVLEMISQNPSIVEKIKKYHSMFVKYEKSLLSVSYSPEFDVNGITDPFLQAKILEILQYTAKDDKELIDELADLFVSVQSITESSKQTGYALQYEIIKDINNLNASSGMKNLSNNILGKFLSSNDYNLKYIALNTLKDVARKDLASVQKHRSVILEFLKDSDISLQKRALDLIYLIINKNNLKNITKECLIFLPKAEDEIKYELTKKLQDSIVKYSISYKWEIDSLIKMVINSKGKLYEDVLSQIIVAILEVKDLYIYSAHKAFLALKMKKNENNPPLAKLCIYIIGELAIYLINNTTLNCKNETLSVTENDILNLFKEIGNKHNNLGNETVIEYLLNALVKLFIKFKDKKSEIESMIKHYKRSYFSEVQSRALEYLQFNKSNKDKMKEKMVEAVPVPQRKKENWEREQKEKRKLVDDKDEDNYEPEDDLICVRLTEGVIKNIQINEMEIKENNNTGLDFLGEKEDENDNNMNNNKQTGNLDLLDLNNIFSAASGNNPADINSNNNNQNNNQGGDPFDILNMQLNQNNQNNNQQSNNDINNILNMVIGNNNTNNNNIPDNNFENKKPTTEINIMKECFKNDDITMYYNITKKEGNNIDGSLYATNNKNIEIIGVKIIFQVQKFVKLNVLSVSGDKLEPNQSLGIKKDFTLTSSEPNKKVTLKIKLQYTINSEEKTEQFMIKNL
jgi:AP-1 complex subunit gamma-1